MNELSPSVWFPVVTLVVGALLKGGFDFVTEGRKVAAEKAIRLEKRKEAILMQRIESQRKTLGELQAALSDLVRYASLGHLSDAKVFRETGVWGRGVLSEQLTEETRATFREVSLLRVRVHDERLRVIVADLSSLCSRIPIAISFEDSQRAVLDAGNLFVDANELIGEALRALEKDEQALLV